MTRHSLARLFGTLVLSVVARHPVAWAQSTAEVPEITVQALSSRRVAAGTTLSGTEARRGAGTQGDAVKALQSLPGLGRGGPGGADIVAWGSSPQETLILVDGVEVPRLYHGTGVRSVVPTERVDSIAVSPGAYGVEYGRALGGLVQIRTRAPDRVEPHILAHADGLDAGAQASYPLAVGKSAVLGAVRYGYADRWVPALFDKQWAGGLYVIPRYWDAQAEVALTTHGGEGDLRVIGMASSDESSVQLNSPDPGAVRGYQKSTSFGRILVPFSLHSPDSSETRVTPFIGFDRNRAFERSGNDSSGIDTRALRYGVRGLHRSRMASGIVIAFGLDAAGSSAQVERTGSLAVPRREGDPFPFGTPPGFDSAQDRYRVHELGVAPFVEGEFRVGAWTLSPGLRVEETLIEASRNRPPIGGLPPVGISSLSTAVEPRLAVEVNPSRRVNLFIAAGRYHQSPRGADLGAVSGNPALAPASAWHLAIGEGLRLPSRTTTRITAFAKTLSDLPSRNGDPVPPMAQSLVSQGEGRSFGVEFFIKQAPVAGFSGWLAVTASRSERRDHPGDWRLSDYDAPLVAALVVERTVGAWRFGSRARYSSGAPRTPVVGAYYDLGVSRYAPLLGAINSERLPDFFQLDLRIDRQFHLSEAAKAEVYLDVLNVTGRRNAEEYLYSRDFRTRGTISGLPFLVVLGARIEL